MEFKRMTPEMP